MKRAGVFLSMGTERTLAEIVDPARAFDEAGADSLWLAEDYGRSDAVALLAAVATVTTSPQLGIGVTHPYTRNPALLAMSCTTIDRLSGGRMMLGLGKNSRSIIEGQLGIPYGKPLALMDETVRNLRKLWAGEKVTSSGYYKLKDVALDVPGPRPRIPIYLGVSGPAGLRTAGRIADGVIMQGFQTPQYARWVVEHIRQGAVEAGRDPAEIDVAMILWGFQIADDTSERIAALKPLAALLCAMPFYEHIFQQNGFDMAILHPLRRALKIDELVAAGREPYQYALREGDVPSAVACISDEMVRRMCVLGTEAECRQRLAEYEQSGVQQVLLNYSQTYDFPFGDRGATMVDHFQKLRTWWLS
jgi:5,10-methylenetetrahydromethanopterin reductase